ncbi:MAG: TonB-dependent receptor [Rudaea sp.]|uniref:TonB-dependent receptor n=1 Tax=Rudaea sp. TaxID=2136325 RepID=UPI001AC9109E|nr:TonB-dependent receptor [Rudaea sp.]MBN8885065.1 TonB-dependent receptor [Rudaea sp.]
MWTSNEYIRAGAWLVALMAPVAVYAQVTYPFDLPAQALADSLRELGTQARINVVFDPAAVKDRKAYPLRGSYTTKEALAKLLEGTGYAGEFTDATTVVIKPLPPKPVSGNRGREEKPVELPAAHSNALSPQLDTVTVLGSLIPRAQIETSSPLITITAEQIKNRGFSSVADALQNATVNTGQINNTSINTNDLWGVKTVSLFGLDPSFTKFLIDGRPLPFYSQTAQVAVSSTDGLYTNLSTIPIDLVDRIEILPGGQSALYGSDALAGVVNIVLKKHVDFGTLDARFGWYPSGGGRERMFSAVDNVHVGKLDLMFGLQYSKQEPIWEFQRRITAQNYAGGIHPQQATSLVYVQGFSGTGYLPQPGGCDKLSALWRGTLRYYENAYGSYCGSVAAEADRSLINKDEAASFSMHGTYALSDNTQLYADVLESYEVQSRQTNASSNWIIDDPNLNDVVTISRSFAPEEISSSLDGLLRQKNYENVYTATVGGKTAFGSGWTLDVAFTRAYERSDDRQNGFFSGDGPGSYTSWVLGPQLGVDANDFPIYSPNYSLLFRPLTPTQFAFFSRADSIVSTDRNDQLRAQLTQTSLFTLPGGDAGLAVVAEDGFESWKYLPGELLSSYQIGDYAAIPSDGRRDRYAAAAELNLPLHKVLTLDLAARYDSYDAQGAHFSHPTYSIGLELRPIEGLLLRGKYSTAFKAPSLIDEFEGTSIMQNSVYDLVNCARLGFSGANITNCPPQWTFTPVTLKQTSNPNLQPLTAKTWSYGAVWSPITQLTLSADFQHSSIRNEVFLEGTDYLIQNQLYCLEGTLDPKSPTCQAANAQIIRAPTPPGSPLLGQILEVDTTKINLSREINNALNASLNYKFDLGRYGRLSLDAGYTRVLTHRQQSLPGDPLLNLLRNPQYSEFQTKGNLALTWSRNSWSATLFGTYYGPTPNYIAYINNSYNVPLAGKVASWRIFNASINFSPLPAWQLSLRANNLMNSMPPVDVTQPGTHSRPFLPQNYNPYGRQLFVEARYQFGGTKP